MTVHNPVRDFLKADDGMTLLEVLVVVAILGLLATLGSLQLMGTLGRARVDTARLAMKEVATAVDLFKIDNGRFPSAQEGLAALVEKPAGLGSWRGPYLSRKAALVDPWGTPLQLKTPGGSSPYDIISLGSDAKPGGDGDAADLVVSADH